MSPDSVRIRVKLGANELEIEASPSLMDEALRLVPKVVGFIPKDQPIEVHHPPSMPVTQPRTGEEAPRQPREKSLPEITVGKGDSLSDVITKLFIDAWARVPRRLGEVREVLESYGLIYPKQSVAVALLRLAQAGKLRRFKGESGDFVYIASSALASEREEKISTSLQVAPIQG